MNTFLTIRISKDSIKITLIVLLLLMYFYGCKRNDELRILHSYICFPSMARDRCAEIDGTKFRIIQEVHSLESNSMKQTNVDSFLQESFHGPHDMLKTVDKNGIPTEYIIYDSMLVAIHKKIPIPARILCHMESLSIHANAQKKIITRKYDSLDNENIQRILHTNYPDILQICEIGNILQQLKERRNDSLYKKIIMEIWSAPGQVRAGDHWSESYRLHMIPRLIFLNNGKSLNYIKKNSQLYSFSRNCSDIDSALKFDIENTFKISITDTPQTICAKEHQDPLPHIETQLMDPLQCGE